MSATPMTRSLTAVPRKDPRGRRRPVGWHRAAVLDPKLLQLHAQLIAEPKPMSGQFGGYVYWWQNGRLHWRRYVVPIDPHTPAQQRSRTAFGTGSNVWSDNSVLTQEQRDAWYAEAAKLQSSPRLGQSGPLTAQQHIVGVNARKERWGLPVLLQPPRWRKQKLEGSPPSAVLPRRTGTHSLRVPIQVTRCQALTPPSSERFLIPTLSLPVHGRWQTQSARPAARINLANCSSPFVQARRNTRFREHVFSTSAMCASLRRLAEPSQRPPQHAPCSRLAMKLMTSPRDR